MANTNSLQHTQGILSIGYLYLVVMGILNETLFFSQVGVGIMKYSSILDVLISPISKLSSNPKGIIFFILLLICIFYLPKSLVRKSEKKWFKKIFKLPLSWSKAEIQKSIFNTFLVGAFLGIFGFFIGTGIGGGYRIAEKIENNDLKYNDKISFINGKSQEVAIIGTNSSYVFYLTNNSKTVKVTPIAGVVESIEEVD